MKRHLYLSILSGVVLSALSVVAAGCAASPDAENVDDTTADGLESQPGTVVRIMPMTQPDELVSSAVPAGAKLTYFGGPVLQKVNVIPVYWNSSVAFQSNLNSFYAGVTNSPLFDMLKQYNTASPAQTISRGTRGTPFVDNQTATVLTDAKVQTELNRLFANNLIPQPNANNLYMVHFPPGTSITAPDGSKSCVVFCAYHGTYVRNGVNVNYGIMPDQGGGCAGGCGTNSQRVNNLTSVSSHELIEAVTDPAVGLATVFGPPLAWYDQVNGEIGDICNAQQGTVLGGDGVTYVVQKEFSNATKTCVTQ